MRAPLLLLKKAFSMLSIQALHSFFPPGRCSIYSLFAAHENLPERAIKSLAPLRITQTLRERCMRENVEKITLTQPDGGCQSEAIINYYVQ